MTKEMSMSLNKSAMFALALSLCTQFATGTIPSAEAAKPAGRSKASVSPKSRLPIWSQGIKVPYRAWLPIDKPRVVLLCIHGLGFSSASYSEFGRIMASRGLATYAMDVRGFGQWMQDRGKNKVELEGCLSDTDAALRA